MSRPKKAVVEVTPKQHTTLQVPQVVKAVLKSIQAAMYTADPAGGVTPMGKIVAEALAEKYPEHALALRKAGLID